MRLDRRLWLTEEGKVVEDGDPKAAFLLGAEGAEIADDEAKRLGVGAKAAAKQAEAPANKARKVTATK